MAASQSQAQTDKDGQMYVSFLRAEEKRQLKTGFNVAGKYKLSNDIWVTKERSTDDDDDDANDVQLQ